MADSGAAPAWNASALRWVYFDGVHYAALLVPSENAPAGLEVSEGCSLVYFLDDGSGAAVASSDVEEFSLANEERTSNPAAAIGIAKAREILQGYHDTSSVTPSTDPMSALMKAAEAEAERVYGGGGDDADSDEEAMSSRARKKQERRLRKLAKTEEKKNKATEKSEKKHDDSEDEEEEDGASPRQRKRQRSRSSSEAGSDSAHKKVGMGSHWEELAEDFGLGDENDDGRHRRGSGPFTGLASATIASGGRRRAGVRCGNGMSGALAALSACGSAVSSYLPEIRYYYQKVWEEAGVAGAMLSATEYDVVTAVERHLRHLQAQRLLLEKSYQDDSAAAAGELIDKKQLTEAAERLSSALKNLDAPLDVESMVRSIVRLEPVPDHTRKPPRQAHRHRSTFVDPSIAYLVSKSTDAAPPRELTSETAERYHEQRMYRERVLASRKGLGKLGFRAVPMRVMECWNRSRELMVLAPPVETQPVMPTGYVPRRYSETVTKVRANAVRRLEGALQAAASQQSDSGDPNHFANPYMTRDNNFASSATDLLSSYQQQQQQQQSIRGSRQAIPAYYNFNSLRGAQIHGGGGGAESGGAVAGTALAGGMAPGPAMLLSQLSEDPMMMMAGSLDSELHGRDAQGMPLISPLNIPEDQRAVLAVHSEDVAAGGEVHARGGGRSELYSASIRLPSQESQWYSEGHTGVADGTHSRAASSMGRSTRRSSRASSVASSSAFSEVGSTISQQQRRRSRRKGSGGTNDWREAAKRAILEQLTLYMRGLKGRPRVLSLEAFKTVARELLERAVQSESTRSGVAMVLLVNNSATAFTKDMERALKRSVDTYMQRHYVKAAVSGKGRDGSSGSSGSGDDGGIADVNSANGDSLKRVPTVVSAVDPAEEERRAQEREALLRDGPTYGDSPMYEDLE